MSDEKDSGSWNPEDDLDVEHITPSTPASLRDTLTWAALKVAIELSDDKDQVFKKMQSWNAHNDPALPEKGLYKKTVWAIQNFDKE